MQNDQSSEMIEYTKIKKLLDLDSGDTDGLSPISIHSQYGKGVICIL